MIIIWECLLYDHNKASVKLKVPKFDYNLFTVFACICACFLFKELYIHVIFWTGVYCKDLCFSCSCHEYEVGRGENEGTGCDL